MLIQKLGFLDFFNRLTSFIEKRLEEIIETSALSRGFEKLINSNEKRVYIFLFLNYTLNYFIKYAEQSNVDSKIKLLLSFLSKVHVANIRVNQESIEALKEIDEVTDLSIYLKFNV